MRDPSFAPPASVLADSGIPNAVAPTAGMGLTLDPKGQIPSPLWSFAILTSAPAGSITTSSTTYVALTNGPSVTVVNTGSYLVLFGAHPALQVAVATDMNVNVNGSLAGNGAAGTEALFTATAQFQAAAISGMQVRSFTAAEVVTLQVKNGAANSCVYDRGWLALIPIV